MAGKCPMCGAPLNNGSCEYCGYTEPKDNSQQNAVGQNQPPVQQVRTTPVSDKSRAIALILCVFLGYFGAHRFYVGKVGSGILYMFTCGVLYVGWISDIISIAKGTFTDSQGRPLSR